MSPEVQRSLRQLKEGLEFHDHFGPASDDEQIFVSKGDTLYEFASLEGEGALRLGDLRNILTLLESES